MTALKSIKKNRLWIRITPAVAYKFSWTFKFQIDWTCISFTNTQSRTHSEKSFPPKNRFLMQRCVQWKLRPPSVIGYPDSKGDEWCAWCGGRPPLCATIRTSLTFNDGHGVWGFVALSRISAFWARGPLRSSMCKLHHTRNHSQGPDI